MTTQSTDRPVVFIDTETTSLEHNRRIWEVGIIRWSDEVGTKRTEHTFQIKDVDIRNANFFSLEIGKFWQRYEGYRPTPKGHVYNEDDACRQILQLTHNATVVGNCVWFDTEGIEKMMCRNGLRSNWYYHFVDVYSLAIGYVEGMRAAYEVWGGELINADSSTSGWADLLAADLDGIKSDDLGKLLGVEPLSDEERHTAIGDARWDEKVYKAVKGIS